MATRKQMYNLTKKLEKFANTGVSLYRANDLLLASKKVGFDAVYDLEDKARSLGLITYNSLTSDHNPLTSDMLKTLRRATR